MILLGWGRHFTSAACIHGIHAQCALKCIFCKSYCRCRCHSPNRTVWRIMEMVGKHDGG